MLDHSTFNSRFWTLDFHNPLTTPTRGSLSAVRARTNELFVSLAELRRELESLEEETGFTEYEPVTGHHMKLSEGFECAVQRALAPTVPSNSAGTRCSCPTCAAKEQVERLEFALKFGQDMITKIKDAEYQRWNGPGSLNYEREQTRRE